jgi:hypothetical protein
VQAHHTSTSYEVYCGPCRVTFPVGTRRCIHCGGPTSASPRAGAALRLGTSPIEMPVEEPGAELEPDLARRRMVSPITLLWIALIVGGYLVRACSGESP